MPFQANYKDPFNQYKFSQAKVISMLKAKGCTGGPDKASAGILYIFSCPGRREAVVPLRDDHSQPEPRADVRVRPIAAEERRHPAPRALRFAPASVVFGTTLGSHDYWDMRRCSRGRPLPRTTTRPATSHGCPPGGGQNDLLWCNRKYTKLMDQAKITVDEKKRDASRARGREDNGL